MAGEGKCVDFRAGFVILSEAKDLLSSVTGGSLIGNDFQKGRRAAPHH